MKLITRQILHPDIEIWYKIYPNYLPTEIEKINRINRIGSVTRKDLCKDINRAKAYLIKEKKFKKGDKVVLGTTVWPEYLIWFFAIAELGGSFLISDSPEIYNSNVIDYRLSLYDKIDHFIFSHNDHSSFSSLRNIFIHERAYLNYKTDKKISVSILCNPNDILLYSTSSGTTSIPKVVHHSHEFFYDLMLRNIRAFNLKDYDRCLHTKNLHHGSVLGVYFLPTIMKCKNHFWQVMPTVDVWQDDFLHYIKKYKLNRCLLYSTNQLTTINSIMRPSFAKHKIYFNVLAGFKHEHIKNLIDNCNHQIVSIFGCTETSGPIFLLQINRDNYLTQSLNNFGKLLDDFYEVELDETKILNVKMPNGDIISTGDQFELKDDEFYHIRRVVGVKINHVPIYLDLLAEVVNKFPIENSKFRHGIEFDLVLDSGRQLIYLRSNFNVSLEDLNLFIESNLKTSSYKISYILVDQREKYLGGIKLDSEKMRIEFRRLLDRL